MTSTRFLLASLALLAATPAAAAPIEIAVTNVQTAEGRIHIDLCLEKQFTTSDCSYTAKAPAVIGTTIVTFPDIPPGRYAAQAFHDRNANDRVDRGLFGIPSEPMGFSRNAPTPWRKPHWSDAVFTHGSEPQRITFTMRKLP